MDIIEIIPAKQKIIYKGHCFKVPRWVTHIAIDKNGTVVVFQFEPICKDEFGSYLQFQWYHDSEGLNPDGKFIEIAKVENFGDWENSMEEITLCS